MKKAKPLKTFKKVETLLWTAFIGTALTAAGLYAFSGFGGLLSAPLAFVEKWLQALFGESLSSDLWSLLAAQLSLTFLSISVLSILSDKNHVLYWKDLVEERLLSPRFCCFAAYTYYSIAASLISFAAVIMRCTGLFLFAFAANIIVLILLTDSILDVYFNKAKHIRRMQKQLSAAYRQAFQIATEKRNPSTYEKIMDDLATQIQRNKTDAQYMREVFELIYNNVALFDTSNTSVQEVMYSQFDVRNGALDLRPFQKVVESAESWAAQVKEGDTKTVYTADWLFWCAASEKWCETECFADIHSHSIHITPLLELEKLLNRRVQALLTCEQTIAGNKDASLPKDSYANGWTGGHYFHLVNALFGCYVAIYGKRLDRYFSDLDEGVPPYDQNVFLNFPKDKNLLGQLTRVVQQTNDLHTFLQPYRPEVQALFLSLIPKT